MFIRINEETLRDHKAVEKFGIRGIKGKRMGVVILWKQQEVYANDIVQSSRLQGFFGWTQDHLQVGGYWYCQGEL